MATYELSPPKDSPPLPASADGDSMAKDLLRRNARWFTKVRWGITALVVMAGAAGWLAPETLRSLGLVPPVRWPWLTAAALAVANTGFGLLVRRLGDKSSRRLIEANIWLQIVLDLLILTVVVHIMGSIDSLVPCLYLLHITLACVFFGHAKSLLVTALAASLYLGCVILEVSGILAARSIFAGPPAVHLQDPFLAMLVAGVCVVVWVAVWYLVSTLSRAVRDRDRKLDAANRDLVAADERMNHQVLRTTHDLKAPFSGMETNIQMLRMKHWESLSPDVRAVLERIETRGQTLSRRIGDILLLGELRSRKGDDATLMSADLRAAVGAAVENVKELANGRRISIDVQVPEVAVAGDPGLFAILLGNLLSNAVCYSGENGQVEVRAAVEDGEVRVSVTDHGIGISEQALPLVFDEYFRTKEAAQANAMSTGLGLAIVKKIAQEFALGLRVTSKRGSGTTFEVLFPRKRE